MAVYLWYCSSSAQSIFSFKDSSVVKTVDLPAKEPFDTSRPWQRINKPYVYVISDNDLYRDFGYETAMKFYGFNFSEYHILGELQCKQCLLHCHHEEGQECHRNRCNKEWVWLMRKNEKAFTEVPVVTNPGYIGATLKTDPHSFLMDTLIKATADTGKTIWYTTGHGDCFARFEYKLYTDKYHPVLLLKEWNYWGGCRAGGSRSYALSFLMPEEILYTTKNTILVEKYSDSP